MKKKYMIKVSCCNYFLQYNTNGLVSNYLIIHQIHDVKKIYKFVKFIVDIHNLLKFFLPPSSVRIDEFEHRRILVVRLVSQQCYINPSVWAIHTVNHLVNKLQLLLYVFGQCRLKNWRQFCALRKLSAATTC